MRTGQLQLLYVSDASSYSLLLLEPDRADVYEQDLPSPDRDQKCLRGPVDDELFCTLQPLNHRKKR